MTQKDILHNLDLFDKKDWKNKFANVEDDVDVFIGGFDRPNIKYTVEPHVHKNPRKVPGQKFDLVVDIVKREHESLMGDSPASIGELLDVDALGEQQLETRGRPYTGIIYCMYKATADALSDYLFEKLDPEKFNVEKYHAGMT